MIVLVPLWTSANRCLSSGHLVGHLHATFASFPSLVKLPVAAVRYEIQSAAKGSGQDTTILSVYAR